MMNRRRFLQSSSLLALSTAGTATVHPSEKALGFRNGEKPRHIIHLVSDGMSMGTLTCADHLSIALRGRPLSWINLYQTPGVHSGLMDMRSLGSLVTDSAAAASSWGSGARILNGMINQASDGTPLRNVYELLGDQGWKRGLVTTTELTHATPAGFAASASSRNQVETIAAQYLQNKIDVLFGGGQRHFMKEHRTDKRDLLADFKTAGYKIVRSKHELESAKLGGRTLGLFSPSHFPFLVDQQTNPKEHAHLPSLPEMAKHALALLENSDHFMIQIEGGRVDHACHNNDAAAALFEQIAFDQAIEVCLQFQARHPDTLIIVTTDHGTGNLALNGMGSGYSDSPKLFRNTLQMRRSVPEIVRRLQATEDPDSMAAILFEATGFKAAPRQVEQLSLFLRKQARALFSPMESPNAALGQLLGNHLGMTFTSTAHTSDYVPILALGPGAERFSGFVRNTDLFDRYMALARVDFKNPQEEMPG